MARSFSFAPVEQGNEGTYLARERLALRRWRGSWIIAEGERAMRAADGSDAMTMNRGTGTNEEPADFLRTVSAEALLQELRSNVGVTIIDVRERSRIRDTGAIVGSRTYPSSQLGARLAELAHLRATRVVVVSQRARRAHAAARELDAAGFGEVFVLEGGMHHWLELGYPVEARPDSSPPSVRR